MEQLAEEAPDGGNKRDKEKDAVDKGMGIRAAMAGGAFLCSVPPSGNGPMTKRFIKEVRHIFLDTICTNTLVESKLLLGILVSIPTSVLLYTDVGAV